MGLGFRITIGNSGLGLEIGTGKSGLGLGIIMVIEMGIQIENYV